MTLFLSRECFQNLANSLKVVIEICIWKAQCWSEMKSKDDEFWIRRGMSLKPKPARGSDRSFAVPGGSYGAPGGGRCILPFPFSFQCLFSFLQLHLHLLATFSYLGFAFFDRVYRLFNAGENSMIWNVLIRGKGFLRSTSFRDYTWNQIRLCRECNIAYFGLLQQKVRSPYPLKLFYMIVLNETSFIC